MYGIKYENYVYCSKHRASQSVLKVPLVVPKCLALHYRNKLSDQLSHILIIFLNVTLISPRSAPLRRHVIVLKEPNIELIVYKGVSTD